MGVCKRERTYWISFTYEGKQYRESTGTDNKQFAKDVLAKRQVEIREQRFFDVKKGTKIGFEELAQDFLRYYQERGRKSLDRAGTSVKHLRGFLATCASQKSPLRRSNGTSQHAYSRTPSMEDPPVRQQ